MDYNRLVVKTEEVVFSDELRTFLPVVHPAEYWRGEGIPTDAQWGAMCLRLAAEGRTPNDLTRQERRTLRIGGITLPLGWRDIAPQLVVVGADQDQGSFEPLSS